MTRPAAPAGASLERYNRKRDFGITGEPAGQPLPRARKRAKALAFVIQKHWASRLHYDFRLELDGVLLSWAVPKGPSFDPAEKRMAVHVEDHPVSYGSFEGTIPARQYGAGSVIVWDRGSWEPVGDPRDGMEKGKLVFRLHGEKLAGLWELVRIAKPGDRQDPWMLFKKRDEWARPRAEYDVVAALPDSVVEKPLGPVEEREPRRPAAARGGEGQGGAAAREPADLSNAVKAPLPATLEPQLAKLTSTPPAGSGWVVEAKFDGYRILTRVERGKARFITRGGHDWTARMASLAREVESLGIVSGWLDGEIVVMNASGVPDFNALQKAIDSDSNEQIQYFVFDAPFLGGRDLRQVPLWSRRAVLRQQFEGRGGGRVQYSQEFEMPAAQMLEAACRMGLEGIVAKRRDASYVGARTETWLKLKCSQRQEFVVIGFTDRSDSNGEVGGLLLAYHEGGQLRYAGSVGTGWSSATAHELHQRLSGIEVKQPALDPRTLKPGRWSKRAAGTERWVTPQLVAEVGFSEWTPDGHVRHPVFKGLREDKAAGEITREQAGPPVPAPLPSSVKVSNPERVIDPSTRLTKLDLVRFYESVADWILPHLKDRPVSLVRGPDGIEGELFFQKHPEARMPGLRVLDRSLWPNHNALLAIDDVDALVAAAQMNTIELHTWNSTTKHIDQPDRVIFDLDPGEGITWAQLQEAAVLTRTMLTALGLQSWLKTSGGKGLHLVVPLAPRLHYGVVKGFSQAVVQHMARTIPQRFVAKAGGANRIGKIFIDWIRNGHGATTAAAFSARARPGLGVSMPVGWDDLPDLKSGAQWSIATAREYLSFRKHDPWAGYWHTRQTLTAAMKALGYQPPK